MASVAQILIAGAPSEPMELIDRARAVPGRGLEGDRYFTGCGTFSPTPQRPDFEVTFISGEAIDGFARESGLPFTAVNARRNIVTTGVDVNELVGKEFQVGSVRFRGIRLCEPCSYLAKASYAEVLRGLVHKGGLRAQILSEGVIQIGDPVAGNP